MGEFSKQTFTFKSEARFSMDFRSLLLSRGIFPPRIAQTNPALYTKRIRFDIDEKKTPVSPHDWRVFFIIVSWAV